MSEQDQIPRPDDDDAKGDDDAMGHKLYKADDTPDDDDDDTTGHKVY
ncbi:MAG: hypothetical protein ACTHPS_30165 [Streptosporangiaceae bacterium]